MRKLRSIHRWISLCLLLFWAVQALTGAVLVFRREIDEWGITAEAATLDLPLLLRRVAEIEEQVPGRVVLSIFSSGGGADRFDIVVEDPGSEHSNILQVNGRGEVLRERELGRPFADGGWLGTLNNLHRHLLSPPLGSWIVAASGLFLLTNLLLGLRLAWPGRAKLWRALVPRRTRSRPTNAYLLHRATGLWLVLPALVLISCGILLALERQTASVLGVDPPSFSLEGDGDHPRQEVSLESAVMTARQRFPQARFIGAELPDGPPVYRIHLFQDGETPQTFGETRLFVSADTGRIVGEYDAGNATPAERFMNSLYPIHTGQVAGLPGRFFVLGVAIWLLIMICLGLWLWGSRRAPDHRSK